MGGGPVDKPFVEKEPDKWLMNYKWIWLPFYAVFFGARATLKKQEEVQNENVPDLIFQEIWEGLSDAVKISQDANLIQDKLLKLNVIKKYKGQREALVNRYVVEISDFIAANPNADFDAFNKKSKEIIYGH